MPKILVNDIDLYCEIHGKGTPLVHLRELAGDAKLKAMLVRFELAPEQVEKAIAPEQVEKAIATGRDVLRINPIFQAFLASS